MPSSLSTFIGPAMSRWAYGTSPVNSVRKIEAIENGRFLDSLGSDFDRIPGKACISAAAEDQLAAAVAVGVGNEQGFPVAQQHGGRMSEIVLALLDGGEKGIGFRQIEHRDRVVPPEILCHGKHRQHDHDAWDAASPWNGGSDEDFR